MSRRRLLLCLGAVACCFIVWLTLPRSGITRANYERIQEGMAEQEVEGSLGGRAEMFQAAKKEQRKGTGGWHERAGVAGMA
jgi:hypothetical protein